MGIMVRWAQLPKVIPGSHSWLPRQQASCSGVLHPIHLGERLHLNSVGWWSSGDKPSLVSLSFPSKANSLHYVVWHEGIHHKTQMRLPLQSGVIAVHSHFTCLSSQDYRLYYIVIHHKWERKMCLKVSAGIKIGIFRMTWEQNCIS